MKDYGKNGNKLVGHTPHPVACYLEDGSLVKEFKTLREAANWLVNEGKARTCNSAQVAITHSINLLLVLFGRAIAKNYRLRPVIVR